MIYLIFIFTCLYGHYSLSAQEINHEKKDEEVAKQIFTLKFQPLEGNSYESSHQLDLTINLPNFQKANETGELELTTGNLKYQINSLQSIQESKERISIQNKCQTFDFNLHIPNQVDRDISKENLDKYPDLSQILSNIEKLSLIFNTKGELLEVNGLEKLSFQDMTVQGVSQVLKLLHDLYLFPDRPVSIGESWNIQETSKTIPISIRKQNTVTLAKVENNIAMLDENLVLEFTMSMPKPNSAPFDVLIFTITGNGTVLVEQSTGWLLEKEMHIESQAKGKMQGGHVEIPLPINITGTFNSKTKNKG